MAASPRHLLGAAAEAVAAEEHHPCCLVVGVVGVEAEHRLDSLLLLVVVVGEGALVEEAPVHLSVEGVAGEVARVHLWAVVTEEPCLSVVPGRVVKPPRVVAVAEERPLKAPLVAEPERAVVERGRQGHAGAAAAPGF